MKEGQKSIYYITGGSESLLRNSPLLEIYKKKDIEVLILDDDIDEIVFSSVDEVRRHRSESRQQVLHLRRPEGRTRRQTRPRHSSLCWRRSRPRSAMRVKDVRASVAACRQSLVHRLRRRRAFMPMRRCCAPWAKKICPRPAHTRNQSRSRDRQEAARTTPAAAR